MTEGKAIRGLPKEEGKAIRGLPKEGGEGHQGPSPDRWRVRPLGASPRMEGKAIRAFPRMEGSSGALIEGEGHYGPILSCRQRGRERRRGYP